MNSELPPTSYAILGLLEPGPMSGYALSSCADESIAHFWSIPRSLVYRELVRLEGLGLVEGTQVAQPKLPDKREYRMTPAGRAALVAWLNAPGYPRGRSKDGLLVKFFFGRLMDEGRKAALLDEYEADARTYLEELRRIAAELERDPAAAFPRLTAQRGIRAAEGQLRWVDDVREALSKNPNLFARSDREEAL